MPSLTRICLARKFPAITARAGQCTPTTKLATAHPTVEHEHRLRPMSCGSGKHGNVHWSPFEGNQAMGGHSEPEQRLLQRASGMTPGHSRWRPKSQLDFPLARGGAPVCVCRRMPFHLTSNNVPVPIQQGPRRLGFTGRRLGPTKKLAMTHQIGINFLAF